MFNNIIKHRIAGYLRQAQLFGDMRRIWLSIVWQAREISIAITNNLPSTQESIDLALKTPTALGDLFSDFYSDESVKQIQDTLTSHVASGGQEPHIAKLLSTLNPHYQTSELSDMMFALSNEIFEQVLFAAEKLADYLSSGLIAQFPEKFR